MSRIAAWTESVRADFLSWVGKSKNTSVEFLDPPRVRVTITSGASAVATEYVVEAEGLGYKLRDQFDNSPPAQSRHDDPLPDREPEDEALSDCWTQWATGPQRTLDELLTDICAEFVSEPDWPAFRQQFEEAAFILADEKLRHFASEFLADPNPLACLWAMAFAGNWSCVQGRTQTAIAKELGITKAGFSKRVKATALKYGQRSHYSKSANATVAYSEREKLKQ